MNLPGFSVRRPVMTSMLTLMIITIGTVSLWRLPIDLLPKVEMPTLSVRTEYENASPEVIERLVTQIIEESVAAVPGVEQITSVSSEGMSDVRITFSWGTNLDAAADDVRDRLDRERDEMPEDIVPPQLRKFDIANYPIVILGVASPLDPVELTELIEDHIHYRIERILGVASVDTFGGFEREVRISLDPSRIKALGLPLDQILAAIQDSNLDLPAGEIEEGRFEIQLRAPAEFDNLDQIRSTVVALRDGAAITLGQIAEVEDTYQKVTRIIRINGEPGVRLGVRKQSDANTVEVAQAVLAEVERINEDFPQLKIVPVINQADFIERSIANVAQSVLYGGALAVIVLLFFLRSFTSTLIIATAIPISIIATFALIFFGNFTINLMTLGGLALGVGMMVDSSIVVLENIFRRRQEEREPSQWAAVRGAAEIGPAIIASTITTVVIFLPLVFVRGVSGVLFSELAYVITFSLICSLIVSLTLVPMLASKLLRDPENPAESNGHVKSEPRSSWTRRLSSFSESLFNGMDNAYRDLLSVVLRFRVLTVLVAVGLFGASLLLVPYIGTEFLPPSDEGEVEVNGEMQVGTRLALVDRQMRELEKIVAEVVPGAIASVTDVGPSGYRPTNVSLGEIRLSLGPATQRDRSNQEVASDLRKALEGRVAGMEVTTRAPQGQFLIQRIVDTDDNLTVEVRGFDLRTLESLALAVEEAIADVAGVADVTQTRQSGIPQQTIHVDRDKAADLGLTPRRVAQALETAVAGSQAGEYRTGNNSYRILVQLKEAERLSLDEILDLTLTSVGGEEVALRNVVSTEPGEGPVLIDRKDQQRVVIVSVNVAGRDMGSVAADIQDRLADIPTPVGYDLMVAGDYEQQQEAFSELLLSLILALALVYMVLACQYESLRDPLVVMLSVPVAAIGVLVTLFITETTLNVQSAIGCIMLGGIVVNNAILLVDQAGRLRERPDFTTRQAVAEAGRRRLRPILMTTLTTILGLMPLALGIGEGADAQAPLARAVVGGLIGSTLITLLLVPAVYSLFHPDRATEESTDDGESSEAERFREREAVSSAS
jgi:HAE1 family hydrophobic/amphiphilic exporter-1